MKRSGPFDVCTYYAKEFGVLGGPHDCLVNLTRSQPRFPFTSSNTRSHCLHFFQYDCSYILRVEFRQSTNVNFSSFPIDSSDRALPYEIMAPSHLRTNASPFIQRILSLPPLGKRERSGVRHYLPFRPAHLHTLLLRRGCYCLGAIGQRFLATRKP